MAPRSSRNSIIAAALVVVVAVAVAGGLSRPAGAPTETPTAVPTAVMGVTRTATPSPAVLVEGIAGRPLYLNPLLAQFSPADRDLTTLIFSGLTKPTENGSYVPDLAERWEVSGDGLVYTFYLRPTAKWHDGSVVTSRDVSTTIALVQHTDFPGVPALAEFWRTVRVEAVDSSTVRFHLRQAYAPFPEAASLGLLQAERWGSVQGREIASSSLNDSPVGTGPYKLKEARVDSLVLTANSDYHGPKPQIGEVVIRFYPDSQSVAVALKRGEVMSAARLRNEDLATFDVNPEVKRYSGLTSGYQVVFLNNKLPYFEDRSARQALLLGLDRQRLIDRFAGGAGAIMHSPVLQGSWAYDAGVRKYPADLEQAKALLEKAGWKVGSSGIREKDEVKFQFTLLTNDDPQRVGLAEEISRQWMALGVKTDVQALGAYGLVRDYMEPRRFEAVLYGWTNLGRDPDPYELWHSSQAVGRGGNYAGLASPLVDEWLEDARQSVDQSQRAALYKEFQQYFGEQVPALLLYQTAYTYAVNSSVQGIRGVPLGDASERFRYIADWSVAGK